MKARGQKRAFAARPSDPDTWVRTPEHRPTNGAKADLFTARLTIDVTPRAPGPHQGRGLPRRRHRRDMLRDLLSREFPDNAGDAA
jgi:hypothetical protein